MKKFFDGNANYLFLVVVIAVSLLSVARVKQLPNGVDLLHQARDRCGDRPDDCLFADLVASRHHEIYEFESIEGEVVITRFNGVDNGFFILVPGEGYLFDIAKDVVYPWCMNEPERDCSGGHWSVEGYIPTKDGERVRDDIYMLYPASCPPSSCSPTWQYHYITKLP